MGDPAGLLLSVRGEARQMVPPDYAAVAAAVEVTRGSKAEAVRAAAAGLESLTTDLAAQGGVTLDASTGRRPLTWSAESATTHAEHAHDGQTGSYQPTGQVTAAVAVMIVVRAFELLDTLGAVLAAHEPVSMRQVTWHVDWDNPAWPDVRAAAIQAAIQKGRDYATALGGSLREVQHIADAGLLGGDAAPRRFTGGSAMRRAAGVGGEPDTPSLDPVPQELTAVIEARLTADGVSLTAHLPPQPAHRVPSCSPHPTERGDRMTFNTESASEIRTPQAVVEEYFARLHRREEAAFDLVAEDFIQHAAAPQGRAGIRQIALVLDHDLGNPEIRIHHVVASGDLEGYSGHPVEVQSYNG